MPVYRMDLEAFTGGVDLTREWSSPAERESQMAEWWDAISRTFPAHQRDNLALIGPVRASALPTAAPVVCRGRPFVMLRYGTTLYYVCPVGGWAEIRDTQGWLLFCGEV